MARSAGPYAMSLIKRQLADDRTRTLVESRDAAARLLPALPAAGARRVLGRGYAEQALKTAQAALAR
ncbi:hypothetical protein ACFYO0_41360 [Streptomyces sp. NPDC006365]|uniref:hypothetical protein n=1 Tax=Streptomyces sp. NPDC006365 TaxID=3364744 RepID=UPI003682F34B